MDLNVFQAHTHLGLNYRLEIDWGEEEKKKEKSFDFMLIVVRVVVVILFIGSKA